MALSLSNEAAGLRYPRRRLGRGLIRTLGRGLLSLLFRVEISGQEHFPRRGPLIVVGNHEAAMEAVMMGVYTPWQVEMLAASDIPQERVTEFAMDVFGCIRVRRGAPDRRALRSALQVLDQGGVVGIFPEGGIWSAGRMPPKRGVAWLSHRAGAPVLPIGFGSTTGALRAALRLRRPTLSMNVGEVLPPVSVAPGQNPRDALQTYAAEVVAAVVALLPGCPSSPAILSERFSMEISLQGIPSGAVPPPIVHEAALAQFLHSPGILKVFDRNLRLNVDALLDIAAESNGETLAEAAARVLVYLEMENPDFLAYRFGPQMAEAMRLGLHELVALGHWAAGRDVSLHLAPVRRYRLSDSEDEREQRAQGRFEKWM